MALLPRMLSAVIWDMDGVLIDSEKYWEDIEREFAVRHGLPWSKKYHDEIMAVPEHELISLLQRKYKLKGAAEALLKERHEIATPIYTEKTQLMPGARELLVRLYDEGMPQAILTSSPWGWVGPALDRFALHRFFPEVVAADDLKGHPGKPAPDPYLLMLEELGLGASACVAVEDSLNGIKSAVSAGVACIALKVPWVDARAQGKIADKVVGRLDEVTLEMLDEATKKAK